jgi:23S rRNA (uracil747-C5)-methyltransferase
MRSDMKGPLCSNRGGPLSLDCGYFTSQQCKSCRGDYATYEDIFQSKEVALQRYFSEVEVLPMVRSHQTRNYRNKAKLAWGRDSQGRAALGVYSAQMSFQELAGCPLHQGDIPKILAEIAHIVESLQLPIYDPLQRTGELKYVIIFQCPNSREMMIRFVAKSLKCHAQLLEISEELSARYSFIKSTSLNLQPEPKAVIEGPTEIHLLGQEYVLTQLGEQKIYLGRQSFYQVNSGVAADLYATAKEWISEVDAQSVVELFCGVGGFLLTASSQITKGVGIEVSAEAVKFAKMSAEHSGSNNLSFVAGDAEAEYRRVEDHDLLLVNPPRRGLGPDLCSLIRIKRPKYILYSSCNPETFGADYDGLEMYDLVKMQAFDMFPWTSHLEVLALLVRIDEV